MNVTNATANATANTTATANEPLAKASDPFLAVFMVTVFVVSVVAFVGFGIYTNWDHERRGRFA